MWSEVSMDLTHPAAQLLGENRARVLHRLSLLADGTSGRAIHSLAGVKSLATTQRTLEQLVGIGLVDARPIGAANLYTLNREHVLWPPIEQLLEAPATTEQRIGDLLATTLGDAPAATLLYGSFARREAGPDSDVDILIVWRHDMDEAVASSLLDDVTQRIRRMTGNSAQIIAVTLDELVGLVKREDPLIDSLRHDARPLTRGVPVRELLGGRT
ncbi:nucleotidyltransferase domain-containing protein [Agromyces sp. NPDC058484]|uniref:nucleotidyltransferase domain-containing protein n=1 Tax=Agromyces sp. NPDC058484 TaxID=3346524 RepID=UPI003653FC4E